VNMWRISTYQHVSARISTYQHVLARISQYVRA